MALASQSAERLSALINGSTAGIRFTRASSKPQVSIRRR